MKQKMNYLLMGALSATLALASCENKELPGAENGGKGEVVAGLPAVGRIMLSQSASAAGPGTRAVPADANAPTNAEKHMNNAMVYVFAEGALNTIVPITNPNTATKFSTTTGAKEFLTVVNVEPALLADIQPGWTMDQVKKHLLNQVTVDVLTVGKDDAGDGSTGRFYMTNRRESDKQTIIEGDATQNKVTLHVGRACAKVNLVSDGATQAGGALTTIEYRVRNNPQRMYLFPVFNGKQLETPYYALPWNDAGADTGNGTLAAAVNAGSYTDNSTTFFGEGTPQYMLENSQDAATGVIAGKVSYLSIKGIWTPDETATFKKANGDPAKHTDLPGNGNFWRIANVDAADKVTSYAEGIYVAAPTAGANQRVVLYTGGAAYYRLEVADNSIAIASEKYAVKRNSYYYVEIKNIKGPGAGNEQDTEPAPDAPVEADSELEAEITIDNWDVIGQSGEIG